jgi:hypothetical protein
MIKIVAFAGRKQSGKTTCSELVQKYANDTKIYNFADPLKQDICMNILGLTHEQCYGDDIDKNTLTNNFWDNKQLTAREVMQVVGTDILRKMQRNVWVDATINKIKRENPSLAIIADCRFPNEVEAIKSAGGVVIKLTRNLYNSDHASETALDPSNYDQSNFDLVIDNRYLTIAQQNELVINFLKNQGVLPL